MTKIIAFGLAISFFTSCSIFKEKRYPSYEEGISEFFKNNYSFHEYDKYNGQIQISISELDTIIFLDSLEIKFNAENSDYLELFSNKLIPSNVLYTSNSKKIRACCFMQFDFLRTKKTQRRFRLWIHNGRLINPSAYYFELTNPNADKKTDLKTFIKGARLTFMSVPIIQI